MRHDIETAYLGLDCTRPQAVADYLRDVVGLMPGEAHASAHSAWRVDGKAQRLWLQPADHDEAACLGLEAADDDAYRRVLARLDGAGVACTALLAPQCELRGVDRGVQMATPWGVPLELVRGLAPARTPFASPHFPDGLVTQGQGFGHVVFIVNTEQDYEASRRFCTDALGMVLSDWLRLSMGPVQMQVSFFHCNARHHSIAIGFVPVPAVPQRLHHVNLEVTSVAAVGAAYERALRSATPLANSIGQHANDRMISFYSISPGGWRVEVGATGRTIGDDWHDVREYDRISDWGHQPPEVLGQLLAAGSGQARPAPATGQAGA